MKKLAILFLSALFLVGMYVPASAADWDFYGSARVNTFWTDQSEEVTAGTFNDSVTELDHDLQGNARLGATVSAGDLGGGFEYGTSGGNANIRKLYGTVNLGGGQLLVGQTYSPYNDAGWVSTQVYGDDTNMLQTVGYNGRNPMVQYSINNFKVALVKPGETDNGEEIVLPRLEASYSVPLEGMSMVFAGTYQTYDLDDTSAATTESGGGDSLDAYAISARCNFDQLDPMYFNLGGFYAVNPGNFGQFGIVADDADISPDGNNVEDTSVWALTGIAGVSLANGIRLEGGVGYTISENDNWTEDDDAMVYYAQANIPLNEGGNAFITPEIGFIDYGDDNTGGDEGDETYAGLKWQINF